GRVSSAIRGNPVEAESLGVHVRAFRVGVFVLGSAVAGLGGALIGTVWNFVVSAAFVWRQR
ncbi:MAG: branched-chain amino acid ABC transporter permease, partial [Xanthobacteraceae bacterium]